MTTIVLRLVGAATLVGQRVTGEARLTGCVGGYGLLVATADEAADLLLQNRPVRIPDFPEFRQALRSVLAKRALAGAGPDGNGCNWTDERGAVWV